MFTFIIVTNRVVEETTKTINTLLATKLPQDSVVIINYSNYSIKYRDIEGIDYRHIKQSRNQAINISLPKDSNVVLLEDGIAISYNFVECLYKHYDFNSLCTLRIDKSTSNGKFIESDYRIGSTITPKLFTHFAIAFNTSLIPRVGETPEETAIIASGWDVPLLLLPNVRVVVSSLKNKSSNPVGITVLIPSLKYEFKEYIKNDMREYDKIYEFDSNPRGVTKFINQMMVISPNNCAVIINPNSKIHPAGMLNRIRGLYNNSACILFDTDAKSISDDAWLVVPKSKYTFTHKVFDTISQLHYDIISYNHKNLISYIDGYENKKLSTNNMISIIIPYMHLGDRWPLFEACIEKLYNCTKNHPNIEIIVHECGPKRYIKPEFITLYNLEYMFSEYHGIFHRAWCLNVVSRFLAKGNTLVFFDGDLIVDDTWVNELLACNKTKAYIGWGEMINLTKEGTDRYLKTRVISGRIERIRVPDSYGPAGGINIIPRNIFFDIGGWPESYKDMGYGGEDNSLAFKMGALEVYGKKMNKSIFKSSVHHLFHGHETKKDSARHAVFNKHYTYKKEDWFEHLRRNYNWGCPVEGTVNLDKFTPYINESLLYVYRNSSKVRLTICIVNFLRYDKLIKSLTTLLSFNIPLNIILWVNQCDDMPKNTKIVIENLLKKFSMYDVIYNKKNMGTGYPRYTMFNKAKFEYDTDYIMTMDDDIYHQNPDSLILGSTILDQECYKGYGAIGTWCYPHYNIVKISENNIIKSPVVPGFHDVTCLGAATMTFRREVLNTCNCDPQYVIGLVDWDFSMSMIQCGWKLGLVCDERYKPINDADGGGESYKDGRWDENIIENSRNIFKKKWGLSGA